MFFVFYKDICICIGINCIIEFLIKQDPNYCIDFGEEILFAKVIFAEARINELKKNYDQALEYYIKYKQDKPLEADVYRIIARCYWKIGNINIAKKNILKALKYNPYEPKTNFEAALIFKEKGKPQKATEHLQRTMEVWKDAEEDYGPAKLARGLEDGYI